MMYVFAIQLVSKRTLQGLIERFKGTRVGGGLLISVLGLLTVGLVLMKNQFVNNLVSGDISEVPMEQIGQALLGAGKYQYVLPFEFISVFLLACIIGGVLIARKEDKK